MRARRTHAANRDDYDSFDQTPPEVYDLPPEAPADEIPADVSNAPGPSLTAPVQVCLGCGDDPSMHGGCPHYEVATVRVLSGSMLHALEALRGQHEALREGLRNVRRLAAVGVTAGETSIEVHEPPTLAPRVVLIPPPTPKRLRRAPTPVFEQGRLGFDEPPAVTTAPEREGASAARDLIENARDVAGDDVTVPR